jgi:myosin-crossreactive antigen
MEAFSGNEAGTGGLVTFKDSSWLMSIVLYHQPHFVDQPKDIQVLWGYALHPIASATLSLNRCPNAAAPTSCGSFAAI